MMTNNGILRRLVKDGEYRFEEGTEGNNREETRKKAEDLVKAAAKAGYTDFKVCRTAFGYYMVRREH
jgi:hypothetical protein